MAPGGRALSDVWEPAGGPAQVGDGEVLVLRARLPVGPERHAELAALLADAERVRAERFRAPEGRQTAVLSLGLRREVLGAVLGEDPRGVAFVYGEHERPSLATPCGVDFNVSHSRGLLLLAVSRAGAVGVDVERERSGEDADLLRIARRYFSPAEVKVLLALPSAVRDPAFFRCWTRKEAFVKVHGRGFTFPLRDFDVTLAAGEPARLLRVAGDPGAPDRVTLFDLAPGAGFAGALAVDGAPSAVRLRDAR